MDAETKEIVMWAMMMKGKSKGKGGFGKDAEEEPWGGKAASSFGKGKADPWGMKGGGKGKEEADPWGMKGGFEFGKGKAEKGGFGAGFGMKGGGGFGKDADAGKGMKGAFGGGFGMKGAGFGKDAGAFGKAAAPKAWPAKKSVSRDAAGELKDWWPRCKGDLICTAIAEAVPTYLLHEKQWDEEKLNTKLKEYFYKAAKNLPRTEDAYPWPDLPLKDVVTTYAETALAAVFCGLGDREWLYNGEGDFTVILHAAIKDFFPPSLISQVDETGFDQIVFAVYDRIFEDQRFLPILSNVVHAAVTGPKIRKKVWNAIEAGRKEAIDTSEDLDSFMQNWITASIALLSQSGGGSPKSVIEEEMAIQVFTGLVEANGVPLALTKEVGLPEGWEDGVAEAVTAAYVLFTAAEDDGFNLGEGEEGAEEPAAKKMRGE